MPKLSKKKKRSISKSGQVGTTESALLGVGTGRRAVLEPEKYLLESPALEPYYNYLLLAKKYSLHPKRRHLCSPRQGDQALQTTSIH